MQIGVMTSTRVDRPLDIYSIFQGERSAGRVSDKPPWRSHQQRRNTWRSHKPQRKQYGYEAYWLSLITLRNAPQPYLRTINQQSLSPRIPYIMLDQNILIFSITSFKRRSNLMRLKSVTCQLMT